MAAGALFRPDTHTITLPYQRPILSALFFESIHSQPAMNASTNAKSKNPKQSVEVDFEPGLVNIKCRTSTLDTTVENVWAVVRESIYTEW